MGGTIKKYTENGVHVKILIMATGILARRSLNFTNSTEYKISKYSEKKINLQIKQLQKQAYAAAKVVDVSPCKKTKSGLKSTSMSFKPRRTFEVTS